MKRGTLFLYFFFFYFFCTMNETKPILTITGSDPTGGSGIQADIQNIGLLGGYAVTAVTSITVQTTIGIQDFFDIPAHVVRAQIEAIFNDVQPSVVKIGLIRSIEVVDVLIDVLSRYKPQHIIYDPLFLSSRGEILLKKDVADYICDKLLPLCTLVIDRKQYLPEIEHGMSNGFASAVAVYLNAGNSESKALLLAKSYVGTLVLGRSKLHGRSSSVYNEFVALLSGNIRNNRDVSFYAEKLNVSSRYLAQVTKRVCQKSPKMIIDDYLVSLLGRELTTSSQTIQQIAYSFGFTSQAHFTKYFKKLTGLTPTKYRENG